MIESPHELAVGSQGREMLQFGDKEKVSKNCLPPEAAGSRNEERTEAIGGRLQAIIGK
jgi:hypothetical protein